MKKVHFVYLVVLMALMAANGMSGSTVLAADEAQVWKGGQSSQKDPFIKVVETPEEWTELWRRAFEAPAPEVDFNRYVVACVFLGHRADWLYSIHIGEPLRRGDIWVVPYGLAEIVVELAGPFKARGQY